MDAAKPTFGTDLKSTGYVGDKLTVKASMNKGQTWTEIWNAQDHMGEIDEDNTPEDVDAFLNAFEDGMKHLQRIRR